ncbi:PREDICTED: c-C motif chemokine 21 [Chrysochloris asiatica]|uniref:C-C motif chemokine 21 n=1 Tax=Chrysochloris asiatica TaxID=185453 RepID=A0A9B0TFN2_CHRAS|nr:PREDICTED: c-C motif chemokine 21 [Chrysochloris asiatica]
MAQSLALSLLVLVLVLCSRGTQGSDGGAQDCCLRYSQRIIPSHIVRGYRKQETSSGCLISAILFAPRKRSQPELCANPNEDWVKQLMQRLDKPPAPKKSPQGCGKDNGAAKTSKKRKSSKACKRSEQPTEPKAVTAQ